MVRPVAKGDGRGLAAAWEDSRAFYSALHPRAFHPPDPSDRRLAEWLEEDLLAAAARDERFVAVADVGEAAVGFISALLVPAAPHAQRQLLADVGHIRATVDTLAVQRRHWRTGVGRALMEAAEQWAVARGARLVYLTTFAGSPVSVPFYDSLDYERRSIVFVKYLDLD